MTPYDPKRRAFLRQMAMMSSFASTLPGFSALAESEKEIEERDPGSSTPAVNSASMSNAQAER